MANNKKYISLNRLSNFLDNLKNIFASLSHKHTISDITDYTVDNTLSSTSTNPVQNKVLDAEFDAVSEAMNALELAIDGKASSSHAHDDRYYTEAEIDTKLASKSDATHNHDSAYDSKGSASAVQENLNTVSDKLDDHTTDTDIHVTTANKTNWSAAYTHSTSAHARADATKVEDSTTNGNIKINGAETNVYSHPNSGVAAGTYKSVTVNAQGHITAASNPTTLAGYGITDADPKGAADSALASAKTYADNAANTVKNDLLNGAGGAYDTLKELGDLIDDNKDAIDALNEVAAGKANATHSHAIADVTGLQSALNGKADSSHGTHVTYSTTAPVMDGTAAVGTASTVARSDHKHPTDTSRASKTEFDSHAANTTAHITASERTNWNAAKTHADSAHAPSNAEKNQNAFSNISVSGQSMIAAEIPADTLTLAGNNVTITTDSGADKVTFTVANGSTSGKGVVQLTDSTSSTSTTTAATPNSVKAAYDLANTAKTTADGKQAAITGGASTITSSNLTASRALVSNSSGKVAVSAVTSTELGYLDGVTSNVQTQLDSKLSTSGGTISGVITTTDGDVVNRNVTTSGTYFYGGTNFGDGAFIGLYGKDQSNYAGQFRLKADNGEDFVYLEGRPDGTLKWNGKEILRSDSDISFTNRAIYGKLPVANGGTGLMGVTFNNFLVGNGNDTMIQKTPAEVLSMINGASVSTLTTAEYNELEASDSINANTLYMLTDAEDETTEETLITVDDIDAICNSTISYTDLSKEAF